MKRAKHMLILLTIPLLGFVYELLNSAKRGVRSLETGIDKIIPFVEVFIIPYIVWYFYVGLLFFAILFINKKRYYEAIIGYNIGVLICYTIYFFFQTTVKRPPLIEENVFTFLTQFIYSNDQPYNAFPSIHVLSTYLLMVVFWKVHLHKFVWYSIQIVGVLIILSTLFVKQHVILDVFASIVIVHFVLWMIRLFSNKFSKKNVANNY